MFTGIPVAIDIFITSFIVIITHYITTTKLTKLTLSAKFSLSSYIIQMISNTDQVN